MPILTHVCGEVTPPPLLLPHPSFAKQMHGGSCSTMAVVTVALAKMQKIPFPLILVNEWGEMVFLFLMCDGW